MVTVYNQQPFAKEMSRLTYPLGGGSTKLSRGHMKWAGKPPVGYSTTGGEVQHAIFNFLYNPAEVSASYASLSAGVIASIQFPNANDTANVIVQTQQYVSWSLYFDRTYEVWRNQGEAGQMGVEVDIRQLKQFTGMFSANQQNKASTASSLDQGLMTFQLAYVYFGSTPQSGLTYYGAITYWDVNYTHWSVHMVPMRCTVDITFSLMVLPSATTGNGVGGLKQIFPGQPTPIGVLPSNSSGTPPKSKANGR